MKKISLNVSDMAGGAKGCNSSKKKLATEIAVEYREIYDGGWRSEKYVIIHNVG